MRGEPCVSLGYQRKGGTDRTWLMTAEQTRSYQMGGASQRKKSFDVDQTAAPLLTAEMTNMFPSTASRHTLSANIPAFIFVIGWTIALTKMSSYLAPFDLYFTFSSFVFGVGHVRPEALAIKLLIPFSAGFLVFYLPARFPSLFARSK